jgi:hypothetical protein
LGASPRFPVAPNDAAEVGTSVRDRGEDWLYGARELVLAHADEAAFPLLLLAVVIAYLMLQDNIDRRDPKLALAPMYDDPELDFVPLALVRKTSAGRRVAVGAMDVPSAPTPAYRKKQ